MQVAMIGLGRMGCSMARRLIKKGQECVVYDSDPKAVQALQDSGAIGAGSIKEMVALLVAPRVVWLMLPAAVVDEMLSVLFPLLRPGDIVIDGGNSYYCDDIKRGVEARSRQIHYVDVGTSGGVAGLDRGYCLMIGGEAQVVQYLDPLFAALAPGIAMAPPTLGRNKPGSTAQQGYLHCGSQGAGHFVKMVHNGIEYGIMGAYAEGLNILRNANIGQHKVKSDAETTPLRHPELYQYELDLPEITELWRRGSVITSWLLDLTTNALLVDPKLENYAGHVSDSGEGRWTIAAAIDEAVPVPILSAALFQRFSSRGNTDFADKVLSAMRHGFGGHLEKVEPKQGKTNGNGQL